MAKAIKDIIKPFPDEVKGIFTNTEIVKAIHRSQHTQRNYDRSKSIPIEDIKTIVTAATQCPSKQNISFYNLHVITNKKIIDSLYETTTSLGNKENIDKPETLNHSKDYDFTQPGLSNPQVLANMLLVFSEKEPNDGMLKESRQARLAADGIDSEENARILRQDMFTAIGIAAGYVNLTASLLGYETGCCSCIMDYDRAQSILGINTMPHLLMGVGFKNEGVNRRVHGLADTEVFESENWRKVFKTIKKQPINTYLVR